MRYMDLREEIVKLFKFLIDIGFTYGKSGNISVRVPNQNLFLVTPSGKRKYDLSSNDILLINDKGEVIEGYGKPSREVPMHLTIYKYRKDVNAIIHAHTVYSSILAVLHRNLPPILDEMILYTGGEVEVAKYAPSGTEELAKNVIKSLGMKKAVILANHGVVTCGKNLMDALDVLFCIERAAKIFVYSSLIGKPHIIPDYIINIEKEMYKTKLNE